MAGEFDRIARLATRYTRPKPPTIGIGDDGAVLALATVPLVATVDTAVEGVHFDRTWLTLEAIGYRATEAALSDLVAMGARLQGGGVLSSLTLPDTFTDDELDELTLGIARSTEQHGGYVLGGNLSRAPVLTITTTALGLLHADPWLRSGARVGDTAALTGVIGAAALGLHALRAGELDGDFVRAWRQPYAAFGLVPGLAGTTTAAIDVSDGLVADAAHIADASGVAIEIDVEALPLLPGHAEKARALGLDPLDLALHGGEDYVLLVTFGAGSATVSAHLRSIGRVVEGEGVWLCRGNHRERVQPRGWDHFTRKWTGAAHASR